MRLAKITNASLKVDDLYQGGEHLEEAATNYPDLSGLEEVNGMHTKKLKKSFYFFGHRRKIYRMQQ